MRYHLTPVTMTIIKKQNTVSIGKDVEKLEHLYTVFVNEKWCSWASLVAQWLRVCLLMQGTRVRALVWEDPTCRGAAGPVSHNC